MTSRTIGLLIWIAIIIVEGPSCLAQSAEKTLSTGYSHKLVYFTKLNKTILVNGGSEEASPSAKIELWAFENNSWKLISADGPPLRNWFAAAYDPKRGLVYLYGGANQSGVLGDFWQWDGTSWKSLTSTPGPRAYVQMAYDTQRDRLVLFGGDKNENDITDETWEWDGASWRKFVGASPEKRLPGAMAYDENSKRIVLYGGLHFGPDFKRTDYHDTWEFDGSKWVKMRDGSGVLKRKIHPDIFYNPVENKTWLIGGSIDGTSENETWQWDGSAWTQIVQTNLPPARSGASIVFGSTTKKIILHGGFTVPGGKPGNDTWVLDKNTWSCVYGCGK